MRGKEVLPFGQPETTYKRGKRKWPPARKQQKGAALPDPGTQGEAQIFQGYLFVGYIFPEQNPNAFVFAKSTIVSKEKKKQTSWSIGLSLRNILMAMGQDRVPPSSALGEQESSRLESSSEPARKWKFKEHSLGDF